MLSYMFQHVQMDSIADGSLCRYMNLIKTIQSEINFRFIKKGYIMTD